MLQKKRIKFSRKCASAKDHSWDEPYILSADKGGISGLLKLMFADAEKGIGLESQAIRSLYVGSQTRERMLHNAILRLPLFAYPGIPENGKRGRNELRRHIIYQYVP